MDAARTSVTELEAALAAEVVLVRARLARAIDRGDDAAARALLARIERLREAR